MATVANFNGYEIEDEYAREKVAEMELSKASHADVEREIAGVNNTVTGLAEDLEELETLFNNSGVTNTAEGISYNNSISGLEATNVQGAIDELKDSIPTDVNGTAQGTLYDNTTSQLEATNVQSAIDEVKSLIQMKYNTSDDCLYIFVDGEWKKWRVAGFKDLVALIPVMMSDTHEKGNVVSNGEAGSTYPVYYAFDGNEATKSVTANAIDPYIGFEWFEHVSIKKIVVDCENAHGTTRNYNFVLQKFDGVMWENISNTGKSVTMVKDGKEQLIWNLEEMVDCKGLRLTGTSNEGNFSLQVTSMQVYGH